MGNIPNVYGKNNDCTMNNDHIKDVLRIYVIYINNVTIVLGGNMINGIISAVSYLSVPIILAASGMLVLRSKSVDLFFEFTNGAVEGLKAAMRLLPNLLALITAVSMFTESGATEYISGLLSPICTRVGIPSELVSFLAIRPISGGASMAMLSEILEKCGADSFVGRCAAVIMGSSDTIVYIVTIYFASVGVKKSRYAIPAAFLTMIFSVCLCCAVSRMFFSQC